MAGVLHRLKYYLIGVGLGIVAVYFMFGKRDFQCSYFPNQRVLNELQGKPLSFTEIAQCQRDCLALDSNDINQFFASADVLFKASDPRKEPCGEYELLVRLPDERDIRARFENCDSTATVLWFKEEHTECDCPE